MLTLFRKYQELEPTTIIQLENSARIPVGAINLREVDLDSLVILETKNISEKYLIKANGISVFFTYWHKIEQQK